MKLSSHRLQVADSQGEIKEPVRKVELLVDRASLETFVNGGQISCTKVLKPRRPSAMVSTAGAAKVVSLRVTTLKGMW
ncbi:MAG: hypothetical protein EOP85_11015 [Verrucomicrobiaceae bacterium]|nr:MAG: hypothetical protein EOP85_11015 [Verrucomicrobiaceae bacterium]